MPRRRPPRAPAHRSLLWGVDGPMRRAAARHDAATSMERYTLWGGDGNVPAMRKSRMDGLCNTSQTLCTRCRLAPRLAGQRWCRQCLTAAQRDRRATQRAAQIDDATVPVTPAAIQAMPHVTQAPAPVLPEAKQGLSAPFRPALSSEVVQTAGASTS